ncbi:MAG: hypothetical protein QM723_00535 [Myxococcaceae bacterium]
MSKGRAAQLVEAGLWLRLSGDHEGAKRLFEQALKLDPENARAKQLLDAPSGAPAASPPGVGAAMDLDWGSATGFDAPEPPRPPASLPPVEMPHEPLPPPVFDVPIEGDVTIGPEVGHPSYGPPEAPTAPEAWTDHVPSLPPSRPVPPMVSPFAPPVDGPPPSNTMVFAGQNAQNPQQPAGGSNTLVFAGQPNLVPPVAPVQFDAPPGPGAPPVSSSTMVMMQIPGMPPPVAPVAGSNTLVYAQPVAPPMPGAGLDEPKSNTLVYAQPVAPPLGAMPASPASPAVMPVSDRAAELFGGIEAEALPPIFDTPVPQVPAPPGASPAALMQGAKSGWDRASNPGIELKDAAPDLANVLDLVKTIEPKPTVPPQVSADQRKSEAAALLRGAKDLLDLDDHSGAMELIVKAQELAPDDGEVKAMRERSEKTLQAMFESKLGDLNNMPRVKLKEDEIIWLNLDHRAGFVLAQIDGTVSYEDLFAVSGMSRLDTARILAQLLEEGVISK